MFWCIRGFLVLALVLADAAQVKRQTPTGVTDKIGIMSSATQGRQGTAPTRSPFLDSIFNIPIQTLQAVNNLVQGIAGNLQATTTGGPKRPVPRHLERHSWRPNEDERA